MSEAKKKWTIGGAIVLFVVIGATVWGLISSTSMLAGKSCDWPGNPYEEGTGHYAGFEWAERKEVSHCGGNSKSFIEGCELYVNMVDRYENCMDPDY